MAQSALGAFGTLYAEKRWHMDARFAALQDVLVQLCLKASELGQWLPHWLAMRQAEAAARTQEMADATLHSGAHGSVSDHGARSFESPPADGVALSPEMSQSGKPRLPLFDVSGAFHGL